MGIIVPVWKGQIRQGGRREIERDPIKKERSRRETFLLSPARVGFPRTDIVALPTILKGGCPPLSNIGLWADNKGTLDCPYIEWGILWAPLQSFTVRIGGLIPSRPLLFYGGWLGAYLLFTSHSLPIRSSSLPIFLWNQLLD